MSTPMSPDFGAVHYGGGKRKGAFVIYLEPWTHDDAPFDKHIDLKKITDEAYFFVGVTTLQRVFCRRGRARIQSVLLQGLRGGSHTAGTVGGKKVAVFHLSQDGKNHQKPAHLGHLFPPLSRSSGCIEKGGHFHLRLSTSCPPPVHPRAGRCAGGAS